MQLGTRWPVGTAPPASVPADLHAEIAAVEDGLAGGLRASWTLTWLEGRAIAELDTGIEVVHLPDGAVVSRPFTD
jgi:hypothetical protein